MKRAALIMAAILSAGLCAQSKPTTLEGILDGMLDNYYLPNIQVAFGSFTYGYTTLPSSYSLWLQDNLSAAITKTKKLTLFNKGASVAMDSDFRNVYADFFKDNMVGGLITGKYFEEAERVKVRFDLTDLSTGNLIAVAETYEAKKSIPAGISIQPDQAAAAMNQSLGGASQAASSASPATPPPESLSVSVSTDRGKGAVYQDGDFLKLYVTVNKDAYVKIYHIDVTGAVKLIWPNYLAPQVTQLKAGKVIVMGTAPDKFRFQLGKPFGTEFIKAVASTTPFAMTEKDFQDLGGKPSDAIRSGAGAGKGGEQAESLASYLINPKR
jgi:hypothetical protein